MIQRISQSFIKDMRDYLDGKECGHLIKHKYVDEKLVDLDSDAVREGVYFEYIAFGNLPKNGVKPEPEYMVSKVKANGGRTAGLRVEDMYDGYRKCHAHASYVTQLLSNMGFVIVKQGTHIVKGRYDGTLDLIVEATRDIVFDTFTLKKGTRVVIDCKYSGLDDTDKWNKHGWAWAAGEDGGYTAEQRKYHGTQAKQYHFLTGLDVVFMVVNNKTGIPKFYRVRVDEKAVKNHIAEGNELYEKFQFLADVGFHPKPEFSRCSECPLRDTCEDKHTYPHFIDVYLDE